MLRAAKLRGHPRKLSRMTGLTLDQFQTLTQRLTPRWAPAERERLSCRRRLRAIGQGRKYKRATLGDTLLCLLVCYRFALTDAWLGGLFGLEASPVCRLQAKREPLLEPAADPARRLPLRRPWPPGAKKIGTWEQLLEVCPDFAEVVTDATEPPRQRPPRRSQRRWYSGKKRRHTVQTQLTVTRHGRILAGSRSVPGRTHDSRLFPREGTARQLPPRTRHSADLGYEGAPTDYPTQPLLVPVQRRRHHRVLTRAERRFHRIPARLRIIVEHVLSRLKKYAILGQVYRHRIADDNRRFRNVAALVHCRLATAVG